MSIKLCTKRWVKNIITITGRAILIFFSIAKIIPIADKMRTMIEIKMKISANLYFPKRERIGSEYTVKFNARDAIAWKILRAKNIIKNW